VLDKLGRISSRRVRCAEYMNITCRIKRKEDQFVPVYSMKPYKEKYRVSKKLLRLLSQDQSGW
jgi:hypothetical protein